ncbi:hypothetical protein P8C59_006187 [Phyllachora maydis]|uniref:Uncharacterized protein n=1 Tax=Phyllachora maydis TaxID=1825666 RepID=A0AAD9MD03_9PEZI|nr:hypothetical protein P8C59_006187 [Phyllachora maydis]
MMASKFYAIVAGIGGGTGASVARRFAKAYPVVPLARRPESYTDLMVEIKKSGGHAVDVSSDTSDPQSVAAAFNVIAKELPGQKPAAAVYNLESSLVGNA